MVPRALAIIPLITSAELPITPPWITVVAA
jgi:hypothetical protein